MNIVHSDRPIEVVYHIRMDIVHSDRPVYHILRLHDDGRCMDVVYSSYWLCEQERKFQLC